MTAPDLDAFLAEVDEFFADHRFTPAATSTARLAPDAVSNKAEAEAQAELDAALVWRRALADAGLHWVSGPTELGGRGLPASFEAALREREAAEGVADNSPLRVGTSIVGPSIYEYGTPEVRAKFLPRVHRGELLVCQLLSEPSAGSDLAGVHTTARRDGDDWIVNGQKVWTSGGRHADVGECLAVTDRDAGRKGLTMFLLDMHAPGVEVRPLTQMTGGQEFCEVFLTDVVVPDGDRLGEVGRGWEVALHTLANERAALGTELVPDASLIGHLVELARARHLDGDPVHRQAIARSHVELQVTRLLADRVFADGPAGPRSGMVKLSMTRMVAGVSDAAARILGPQLTVTGASPEADLWAELLLGAPGLRIGGGTDEILLNLLGERVLGLPREPRP